MSDSKFVTIKCLVDVALVGEKLMQRNELRVIPANVAAQYAARHPNAIEVVNSDGSVIVAAGALEENTDPAKAAADAAAAAGGEKLADLQPGGAPGSKSKKA